MNKLNKILLNVLLLTSLLLNGVLLHKYTEKDNSYSHLKEMYDELWEKTNEPDSSN